MLSTKCAIYCRLSRDDGTFDESSSIQTQKDALRKYALQNGFEIYKIYIDDGISGTHDNRPGFQEMLSDIEMGKFQVLLTKDLSRLARNYLQAGYYMEEFFPKHHIRYIAVNDNYDSLKNDNEFAPFKNIINEWYAKDISKKVKYAFNNMKKAGIIPTGLTALYGYKYDDKRNRIIDEEAANVVRYIFDLYIKYQSGYRIMKILCDEKVYTPGYYFYIKYGINKKKYENIKEEDKYKWNCKGINKILRNSEYKGDLILNKTYIKKIGSNKEVRTKKEDFLIHKNRFEAIVDETTFDDVQRLLDKNKTARIPVEENPYKSLFICANCLKPLKYANHNYHKVYECTNSKCNMHVRIKKEIADKTIENEMTYIKDALLDCKDKLEVYAKDYVNRNIKPNIVDNNELKVLKTKLNQIELFIEKLIENSISNIIPQNTFDKMMKKYKNEYEELELKIKNILNNKPPENHLKYLTKFIEGLNNINPKEFDYEIFSSLVTDINVNMQKTSYHNRTYDFKFNYKISNEIIKGFINEYKTN